MCDTCGCNVTPGNEHLVSKGGKLEKTDSGREAITVLHGLLHENDHMAQHNREHFSAHGVVAINLMSSPGAGKTSLLEATINALQDKYRIAVIEGDLETENDAERIRRQGAKAIQITTGSACHLDAHMVHEALHELDLADFDLIFIETGGTHQVAHVFNKNKSGQHGSRFIGVGVCHHQHLAPWFLPLQVEYIGVSHGSG